jgi:uncharacterized protein (TIGR03437 family)
MRDPKNLIPLHVINVVFVCLFVTGSASAQFTITDVVNAGSRIGSTSSSGGIPQGALFIASIKGIGSDQIQQASFPLPTIDGLGGVTIQIASAGAVIDAIMVYLAPNEVAAILPSATPLGPATITVNKDGVSATKAIKVIAAAFGIFVQFGTGGAGAAVAFNVAGDGSSAQNSTALSAMAGQDVLINGTGLGAIASDETQPGVTDVPGTAIQVYVGTQPATVVSAGRGYCCDGLDPSFRIPPGIAAWDVIRFTVPDGVVGCYVPVVAQIGTFVSNLAVISIDPSGAACALPPSTLPPDLAQKLANQTRLASASISLSRGFGLSVNANTGAVTSTKKDTGSATFFSYANIQASSVVPIGIFSENVCTINGFPNANGIDTHDGNPVTIPPPPVVTALDAGTPLTVKGPAGTKTIVKRVLGALFDYPGVTFGDTTPGNYFDAGHYTVTGSGGKDVGVFTASTDVPSKQFLWTNMLDVKKPIDRTQDLTLTWTGGVPGTQVTAVGGSNVNGVNIAFLCAAAVEAGQMTIPSYVLLNLPPTGTSPVPGQLTVGNDSASVFMAPGLDWGALRYGLNYTLFLKYQ